MDKNNRSLSKSARYIMLVLLLWVVGLTEASAQDFIYQGLKYRVTGENTVTLLGHENGNNATGILWLTSSVYYAGHYYSVTKIGASAFAGCTGLSSGQVLSIPNSVTSIGNYAFNGCTGLSGSLTISNSTTYIGAGAFYGCTGFNLTLTIPESVTEINVTAFSGTNFSTVKWNAVNCYDIVPSYSTYGPFANISNFKYIHIGSNVQSLPAYVFYGCSHLKTVYSQAENPPVVGNYAFDGVNTSLQVNVPCGAMNAYQTASGWNVFNIVESDECEYLITGLADPVYAGSVSGSGTYNNGTACTLTANPNPGYYFMVWTENGAQVTTDVQYTFTVTNDRLLVAHFQQQTYTIDVSHFPSAGGTVAGGGTFTYGNSCTVTATPNPGFLFVNWTEDGNEVSTNESYTFNVTDSRSLKANFVLENVGSEQIVFADANVKAVCVANWDTNGDGELSYDEAAAVTSIGTKFEQNTAITIFNELQYFTSITKLIGGERPSSGIPRYVLYGAFRGCTNLTSIIIPNNVIEIENYAFRGCSGLTSLTVYTVTPPTLGNYTFNNVPKNIPVYVPCAAVNAYMTAQGWNEFTNYQGIDCDYHQIYLMANPDEGGTVTGAGSYLQWTSCTLTATASEGWTFVNWTEDGNEVSTDAEYTFTVTGERTIVANFNQINPDDIINFADANVKTICVANWDTNGDGELSYDEATAVTTLGYVFSNNTTITTFNELQYFIGLTELQGSTNYHTNPSTPGVHPGPSTPQIGGGISGGTYYYYGEFIGCSNLTSITIPENVTTINTNVFKNCTNLETLTVKAETPPTVGSATFYGVNKSIPVYVPTGTIPAYQSASGWDEFTNFQEIPVSSCEIAATSNPPEGGTVTGDDVYNHGSNCTLTATANEGYTFVNWTENGNEVSTNTEYTFTVTGNRALVANFNQVDPGNENPTGSINGKFTVNSGGSQVYFSQGNLQFIGSASIPYWKFADHQWDYLGNNGQGSTNQNVDRDLFGWGTSGYNHGAVCYQPYSNSESYSYYYAYGNSRYNLNDQTGQADWGYNPISNGGNQSNQWRTLTRNEWVYVFNTRNTASGIRYAKANVNNVNGVILLPDDWSSSYYSLSNTNTSSGASYSDNTISAVQWNSLEQHGAVFFPAAGRRGTGVIDVGSLGYYWSATCDYGYYAYDVYFSDSYLEAYFYRRNGGLSVRLVCAVENYSFSVNATPNPAEGGTVTGSGNYVLDTSCTLTATPNEGYTFVNWTENGNEVSTDAECTFTVTEDRFLVANFDIDSYEITASANPTGYGTVTGADVYYHGSSCTLTATANEGYTFVNWTENGNQVSTDAEYTFTVTGNRALMANFQIAGSIISHWTPCDEGLYSGSTTVMAVVKINGIEQHSPQIELAAFCGNECRGTAWTSEFPVTHRYLALVNVYGENGDELTFKAYNHATNQELEMDPEVTITFSDDGSGTLFEPLELNFVSSAVTQTINLVAGTNWVSANVEITLDDLKAALVAASPNAAITIKSQTQKATYNPSNGRWTGRLTTFDLSQMYKITVGSACEITFEGVRINPAEHPVTITPGANWIAYPLNTSMTPQEVFTGFAVPGDMVKSQSQKKQYNSNGRWTGQLGNLEPGKGYIYTSSATEDRVFVFPTGAK
jgi:hypothetical protein